MCRGSQSHTVVVGPGDVWRVPIAQRGRPLAVSLVGMKNAPALGRTEAKFAMSLRPVSGWIRVPPVSTPQPGHRCCQPQKKPQRRGPGLKLPSMGARCSGPHLTEGTIAATQQVADVNRRRLARSLNRTPETRRASLSDERNGSNWRLLRSIGSGPSSGLSKPSEK